MRSPKVSRALQRGLPSDPKLRSDLDGSRTVLPVQNDFYQLVLI